tara:strand:- start:7492 stop:7920 length:429 start_codon:yes stop_codon:yes gene_type:complete
MIYIASDHTGYKLKEKLKKRIRGIKDLGPYKYDKNDDYSDYAIRLGKKVSKNKNSKGILICGTGQGMAIAANKIKGIRATLVYNKSLAKQAKQHLNANIITLSGKTLEKRAKEIINIWLKEKFQGGRHSRRLSKIKRISKKR